MSNDDVTMTQAMREYLRARSETMGKVMAYRDAAQEIATEAAHAYLNRLDDKAAFLRLMSERMKKHEDSHRKAYDDLEAKMPEL